MGEEEVASCAVREPEGTRAWGQLLVLPFASLGAVASWWPCRASGLGTHPGWKADCGSELLQKDGRWWGGDMSPRKYVGAESAILWATLIVPKESGVSCGQ